MFFLLELIEFEHALVDGEEDSQLPAEVDPMKEDAICPCNDQIVKICSKIISDDASIAVKCQIVEKLADFLGVSAKVPN